MAKTNIILATILGVLLVQLPVFILWYASEHHGHIFDAIGTSTSKQDVLRTADKPAMRGGTFMGTSAEKESEESYKSVSDKPSSDSISLIKGWEKDILSATSEISFKKVNLNMYSKDLWFWYSVQETWHSASYIIQQERGVLRFWINILNSVNNERGNCNVIDIGSNGGTFSLMSRKMGCKTVAVDAQPWCLKRLSSSAAVNGFQDNFFIKWGVVSEDPNLDMQVGATKCSGLWSAEAGNDWINKESLHSVKAPVATMKDIFDAGHFEGNDNIDIMKIDAEGSEFNIIAATLPYLKAGRISHIIVEIAPKRVIKMTPITTVLATIETLESYGYEIAHIGGPLDHEGVKKLLKDTTVRSSALTQNMFRISKKV